MFLLNRILWAVTAALVRMDTSSTRTTASASMTMNVNSRRLVATQTARTR